MECVNHGNQITRPCAVEGTCMFIMSSPGQRPRVCVCVCVCVCVYGETRVGTCAHEHTACVFVCSGVPWTGYYCTYKHAQTLPPDSFRYCFSISTRTSWSKAGFTAAASKYSGTASACTCSGLSAFCDKSCLILDTLSLYCFTPVFSLLKITCVK